MVPVRVRLRPAFLALLLIAAPLGLAAPGLARAQDENPTTPGAIPNPGSYQGSMELQRRESEQNQQYYQQQQRQPDYYPGPRGQSGYGAPRRGGLPAPKADIEAYNRGDYATAYRLTLPLAQRGDRIAQYNMGTLYAKGLGVRQDQAQAVVWFRRAAEQGVVGAANDLGIAYGLAQGVPRDTVQSYVWLTRAAAWSPSAHDRAAILENRRYLVAHMAPADLARAQSLTGGAGPAHRRRR
jgi:hypothetical protein